MNDGERRESKWIDRAGFAGALAGVVLGAIGLWAAEPENAPAGRLPALAAGAFAGVFPGYIVGMIGAAARTPNRASLVGACLVGLPAPPVELQGTNHRSLGASGRFRSVGKHCLSGRRGCKRDCRMWHKATGKDTIHDETALDVLHPRRHILRLREHADAKMTDEPLDEKALNVLEAYLARLQAGEKPDRAAILREHPELLSAINCLDALEQLAPPAQHEPTHADGDVDIVPQLATMPCDFGPYELIREIGRGGMGVVYEARQKGLDRSVAVKMILAGHLASPELVRRFQTEARAAARLRHSNIVHIHDVGQFNGQHFFAMEYIEGPSLAQRIQQGPSDVNDAARLVSIVARAVEHLHQQGIIHRDLKPSNILLDADGQPYVTDFGLAKVFADGADVTATGVIAGTPSYMAPEQASGRRAEITPATDVYSLGVILYELLTGRPPFHEESTFDTLMAVLSGDPPMPRSLNPRIPRGLELICLKCLAKEPRERYESAAALADDLDRFARGEVLAVRPPTMVQRCWSWVRRQPALASRLGRWESSTSSRPSISLPFTTTPVFTVRCRWSWPCGSSPR